MATFRQDTDKIEEHKIKRDKKRTLLIRSEARKIATGDKESQRICQNWHPENKNMNKTSRPFRIWDRFENIS